jgi:hypothetical protein
MNILDDRIIAPEKIPYTFMYSFSPIIVPLMIIFIIFLSNFKV